MTALGSILPVPKRAPASRRDHLLFKKGFGNADIDTD